MLSHHPPELRFPPPDPDDDLLPPLPEAGTSSDPLSSAQHRRAMRQAASLPVVITPTEPTR